MKPLLSQQPSGNQAYDPEDGEAEAEAEEVTTPTTATNNRNHSQTEHLMPHSASLSFSVKNWVPSGIKVDGLLVDTARSRGLGEGVRPVKGVKYLCVSRGGVEGRC